MSTLHRKIADALHELARRTRSSGYYSEACEKLIWQLPILTGSFSIYTYRGRKRASASFSIDESGTILAPECDICREQKLCRHHFAMALGAIESGLTDDIEDDDLTQGSYSLETHRKSKSDSWETHLRNLSLHFGDNQSNGKTQHSPPAEREVVFILERQPTYSGAPDHGQARITIATRPANPAKRCPTPRAAGNRYAPGTFYRTLRNAREILLHSSDPLENELAKLMHIGTTGYYGSDSVNTLDFTPRFHLRLLGDLARSGRLFYNSERFLHDEMVQVGWLGDEPLTLKLEIREKDEGDHLALGIMASNSTESVSKRDIGLVEYPFLIDKQNRLGIIAGESAEKLADMSSLVGAVNVPKSAAPKLIRRVYQMPGVEVAFAPECRDLQPTRVQLVPRPGLRVKRQSSGMGFSAALNFDYDGEKIPAIRSQGEIFHREKNAVIPIDSEFQRRSLSLLVDLGARLGASPSRVEVNIGKAKFPKLISRLVHEGWHIEAEGKLYRPASTFDVSITSGIDWFELGGQAHFGEISIDLPALLQCIRNGESTVLLDDGTLGMIPEQWMQSFGRISQLGQSEDGALKFGRSQVGLLDALLAGQGQVDVDAQFSAAREALRKFEKVEPQEPTGGFTGELRPYQKLALGWFEFLRMLGFGGCLADDMGLGKTVQVLALLERRRAEHCGPSLLVVPRSLVFNWIAEAGKFTPQLRILDQSHSQRTRGTEHLGDYDLVITTYGTLRRDAAFLKDFEFDYIILDEAQAIKNASTEASKAARLLQGRHRLALSGTPIENHLRELWSLFDFLNPGMLGRIGQFTELTNAAGEDQRHVLAAAVRPFVLRRTKRQVAPELPDRVEQTVLVQLDPEDRKRYDELREYYRQSLLQKIERDGIAKSQIIILEALLRLRQAACHPGLIDKSLAKQPSAKLDELMHRLSAAAESSERVLVFSQFTSLLAIVKKRLATEKLEYLYLDGQTRNRQELVEQFQSGTGPGIFLISLKAGGVGLNLTAARTVYLLDPWWNPAVEAQAIDRTHRIGQQQVVFATRLIAADTVEQKVLELQARKRNLADAIISDNDKGISSLTREDLDLLLA